MYSTTNAQQRINIGTNRKDVLENHKNINPNFYSKTEMMFSGKAGKRLKGGFKKGGVTKEQNIFENPKS
jgi:site-specific recombinase XerC